MNRLFRRNRGKSRRVSGLFSRDKQEQKVLPARLTAERLEDRVLLTTLTLPKDTPGETLFIYADPEETDPDSDVSIFNEIRIGTYSDLGPAVDVEIEILNYRGDHVPGTLSVAGGGGAQVLYGGPGGGRPVQLLGPLAGIQGEFTFECLATSPTGVTYGIGKMGYDFDEQHYLVQIDAANLVPSLIGVVEDGDGFSQGTVWNNPIGYDDITAAEFDPVSGELYVIATSPTQFDAMFNGLPSSTKNVMLRIDTVTGEADPVGVNGFGNDDYTLSVVSDSMLPSVHTILYSQEDIDGDGDLDNDDNMGDTPTFIAFESSPISRFISVSLAEGTAGPTGPQYEVLPATQIATVVTGNNGADVISGLMYGFLEDGSVELFGLHDDSTGQLVMVDRNAGWVLVDVVDYSVSLRGMSFDVTRGMNGSGLAISQGGDLYDVTTEYLVLDEEGNPVIVGGVSDIYMMYIASSTADVYVTITRYSIDSDGVRTYTPASGDGAFLFVDDDESEIYTPDAAGGVMIGTIPQVLDGDSDDITWSPGSAYSRAPGMQGTFFDSDEVAASSIFGVTGSSSVFSEIGAYPGGEFRPGIVVASGAGGVSQDIGLIQVGGGIFGDVVVSGSIGRLYAGYLGTNRVEVGGDLGQLVVATQAGGIEESDGSWRAPEDVILDVSGEMGSFYSNDDWGLPIYVRGLSNAPSYPGVLSVESGLYVRTYREIEFIGNVVADEYPDFIHGATNAIIRNDTLATAEYLGEIDGKLSVLGVHEEGNDPDDLADFFSFSVMAGQTISVVIYDVDGIDSSNAHPQRPDDLDVYEEWDEIPLLYDVDGVVVGCLGEYDIATATPMPLTFTAEKAGIYTIEIPYYSGVYDYRLDITGVSETALGGGTVLLDMRHAGIWWSSEERANIQVVNGNVGAVNIGGMVRGSQFVVNNGDFGALRATGEGMALGFGWEIDDDGQNIVSYDASLSVGGDIGQVISPVNSVLPIFAHGDVQSVRFGAVYVSRVIADGNIGEIRVDGDYGPVMQDENGVLWGLDEMGFFANADGIGDPGVIDRIYVGGDLGQSFGFVDDVPVSVGERGGNVRFVDIGGAIYQSIGGWFDAGGYGPFTYEPGQSVDVTDDSGAIITISPGYRGDSASDDWITNVVVTGDTGSDGGTGTGDDGDDGSTVSDAGVLTVQLLPIRDQKPDDVLGMEDATILGYAIAGVDSTDGLRVSADGGPVELGYLNVAGVEGDSVVFSGGEAISVLQLDVTGSITRIINRTQGGDIVAIVANVTDTGSEGDDDDDGSDTDITVYGLDLIEVDGHIGWTVATTGQRIETAELMPSEEPSINPIGSQTSGLVVSTGVNRIYVAGGLGDTNIAGNVNVILLDSDASMVANQFDGVIGAILIGGDLNRIDLGDGIFHPGRGDYALSGLFVRGSISKAEISGYGNDIGGPILATGDIDLVSVRKGACIVGYNGFGVSERVRGVSDMGPSIATSADFDDFVSASTVATADIGKVEVIGNDSEIRGGNITGLSIGKVYVNGGAEGIFNSRIDFMLGDSSDMGIIGDITVGGQGIYDSIISAGRDLEKLTLLNGAVLAYSEIHGAFDIGNLKLNEVAYTDINAFNSLNSVKISGDATDLVIEAGEVGKINVKGDMIGSGLIVAGPVDLVSVSGDLISTIEITGPYGNLKKMVVGGDLGTYTGGEIIVDGKIGTIQVGGDLLADLLLNWDPTPAGPGNPGGPHAKYGADGVELKQLRVGGEIEGVADVGGDVGSITSGGDFGVFREEFSVYGDLGSLKIGSGKAPADLESSVTVTGDLGKVCVYGSVNGNITVDEDFGTLMLKGSENDRADLNADITVGGNFKLLKITEGDISETNILDGTLLEINVGGEGPNTKISGSDINATEWHAHGAAGINIDGSYNGTYVAGGDVDHIILGGDLAADAFIVIDGDLDELIVGGDILGVVYVTGDIGRVIAGNIVGDVSQLGVYGLVVAGGDIDSVDVSGSVDHAYILAGYELGLAEPISDRVFATNELSVNGSVADVNEAPGRGDIGQVNVDVFISSVIAAGVGSSNNIVFGDTDGSDTPGDGISSIGSVTIGSTDGDGSEFGVFADSEIGKLRIEGRRVILPATIGNGFRAWTVSEPAAPGVVGFPVSAGTPFKGQVGGEIVTITLSGPGVGQVVLGNDQIDTIFLTDTTLGSKLTIKASGGSVVVGEIYNNDDEDLGQLKLGGVIGQDGLLDIGGNVNKIALGGISAGAEVLIDGDVSSLSFGTMLGDAQHVSTVVITGALGKLMTSDVSSNVELSAWSIANMTTRGEMGGAFRTIDGDISQVKIVGDMTGLLRSSGDIDRIIVTGEVGGSIGAVGDIASFTAGSMNVGTATAGGDFLQAKVKGDVSYSTLAAGLDSGADANPYTGDDVASSRGDFVKASIGGDFIASNIVAGIAPGQDDMFGTADDMLEELASENRLVPEVVDVDFPDLYTIAVQFRTRGQGASSDIIEVVIGGHVQGSSYGGDSFAIAAAGEVKSVIVHRESFGGSGNVVRMNVEERGILPTPLLESDIAGLEEALAAAFRVSTDGMDHRFGQYEGDPDGADDIYIYGAEDVLTNPTVYVTFDESEQKVIFHKDDGFLVSDLGTNYYKIMLDGDSVMTRSGATMEADYEYFFAVGDLGDNVATAFSPFGSGAVPDNFTWVQAGEIGDNRGLDPEDSVQDQDVIRLNGLKTGAVLDVKVIDDNAVGGTSWYWSWYNSASIDIDIHQALPDRQWGYPITAGGTSGQLGLDPARGLVVPDLEVLAFSGGQYYAYDSVGGRFYTLNPEDRDLTVVQDWYGDEYYIWDSSDVASFVLLPNDLSELNNLIADEGRIADITALAGYRGDSLWAVGEFVNQSGASSTRLFRISNISSDMEDEDEDAIQPVVYVYPHALGFETVFGLAELDSVLYGVDNSTGTLLTIDTDTTSGSTTSGVASAVGGVEGNITDGTYLLNVTGMSVDSTGSELLILHDQEVGDTSNLLVDALYTVDCSSGDATISELLDGGGNDRERQGLAVEPNASMLVGLPLRGTLLGDSMTISFGEFEDQTHVFGDDFTVFGIGSSLVTVDSSSSRVEPNTEMQPFVDEGYYYAFDITYENTPGLGVITVTIDDIDWINDTEDGEVVYAVSDDAANVVVRSYPERLVMEIDTVNGAGDVRVFFAGSSQVELLEEVNVRHGGTIIGDDTRYDMEELTRDMVLPFLTDVTAATEGVTLQDSTLGEFYDAIGYDSQQEIFAMVDLSDYNVAPIIVTNPSDATEEIALTRGVLSDIYNAIDSTVTITAIHSVEFAPDGGVYMVVAIEDTDATTTTRNSLLWVGDIQAPGESSGMLLSPHNLEVNSESLTISSLAYGNRSLYGVDVATGTLVELDGRLTVSNQENVETSNAFFGEAIAFGDELGNLSDDPTVFDITGLDFDSSGRLLAVDNNTDVLLQVSLEDVLNDNSARLSLVRTLTSGNYQELVFGSDSEDALLIRSVTGSPLDVDDSTPGDQGDTVTITVDNTSTGSHVFGSSSATTVGPLTIGSSNNSSSLFEAEGGYYVFDVTYPVEQGQIEFTISGIDWPDGSSGQVDAVLLVDTAVTLGNDSAAVVKNSDRDVIEILIDTDKEEADGVLHVYFAATSDMMISAVDPSYELTQWVSSAWGWTGTAELLFQIPDDGDYIVTVSQDTWNNAYAMSYEMSVAVLNDGNGDFDVDVTPDGYVYDPVAPYDSPVNVEAGSEDIDSDPLNANSQLNREFWPLNHVDGSLTPGQASEVVVDSELFNDLDVDIYTFRLAQGQRVAVDLDSEALFGRDNVGGVIVGIYNGDLEAVSTVYGDGGDNVADTTGDLLDPYYDALAIFTMPGHSDVVIDPSEAGFGTYYVVVSVASMGGAANGDEIPYRLTITTSDTESVSRPESQLVFLDFEGKIDADYLLSDNGAFGGIPGVVDRPAFDAEIFDLENMRVALMDEITDRIEQMYRDTGLGEDEIDFTLTRPALGTTYSTVSFGGKLPMSGLLGIAQSVDRDNSVRDDMAVVLTDEIAAFYAGNGTRTIESLDDDPVVRFDQVATLLSNLGAHELGHILGLEHATEVDDDPNNTMGYNDYLETQAFESGDEGRNDYWYQIGFTDEVDTLLRNIGSGTAMGF